MDTIKQITEENGKGIHSMFNACMHKSECRSKDDEIADLKRQLEEANDMAKRCSDWGEERRQSALDACEMAMQRKEENEALRQQLAESQAREARLREALFDVDRMLFGDQKGFDHELFYAAILIQHDDTALKEYVEEAIRNTSKGV